MEENHLQSLLHSIQSLEETWSHTTPRTRGFKAGEAIRWQNLIKEQSTSQEEYFKHPEGQEEYFKRTDGQEEITCHDPKDRADLLLDILKSGKKLLETYFTCFA